MASLHNSAHHLAMGILEDITQESIIQVYNQHGFNNIRRQRKTHYPTARQLKIQNRLKKKLQSRKTRCEICESIVPENYKFVNFEGKKCSDLICFECETGAYGGPPIQRQIERQVEIFTSIQDKC